MSVQALESLPHRPPTPPREPNHDSMGDVNLQPTLARPLLDHRLSLHTPPSGVHSPTSTAAHSILSSGRSGKNVAFASLTECKEAPSYDAENRATPPSGPLVPSAKSSKPRKGILKPSLSHNTLDISFESPNGVRSLVDMLDSSLRKLAGDDLADKTDAYDILHRSLMASNNLPDRVALRDRMPRFTEYIQRDITTSPLHSSLAIHALKFLLTILHFPGVSSSFTTEFSTFMIDHCIRSFEDSSIPKDVTRHLLQVVAQQNFSHRVMNSERVTRLLTSLSTIENHVTGKSIIHSRIMIYRRLMKQCKSAMVVHTGWLRDLITDTLSTTKDIRGAAIVFGFEAAAEVGKDKQVSKKLAELFRSTDNSQEPGDKPESEDKREYIDLYIERLRAMLRSRQDAFSVPRIWSVVLLLLRGIQLDKWQSLNPWLHVIQQCFNTSDMQTRQEANYAWNRFVYVLHFEEASFSKLIKSQTLCQPVCSQWKRKTNPTKTDEGFQAAIFGSACNLFYYMFRPGISHDQLSRYWEKGLKPVIQQLCAPGQGDDRYDQAICILTNLFDVTTGRQWVQDRALTNPLADASDLPALEPKWLRRNAGKVFQLVQPILERRFGDLADTTSSLSKMWQTLITSVSSAASKEIKVSSETTEFVSQVLASLSALWKRGVTEGAEGQDADKQRAIFLASTRQFVTVVVTAFGALPFTEKQQERKLRGKQDVPTPSSTPSHQSPKTGGVAMMPLHHLFSILSSIPDGVQDDEAFSDFFESVFKPFFRTKNPKASSALAQEMLNWDPVDSTCPYGPWVMVANTVKIALAQGQSQNESSLGIPSSNEVPVGREYRGLCRILERGLKSTPNLPWEHWLALLDNLEARVSEEMGDAGRALAVVEPLAKMIFDHVTTPGSSLTRNAVHAATALLLLGKQPRDRQAVDVARRRLWGTAGAKSASFDPFDNLYKLSNFVMQELYKNLDSPDLGDLAVPFMDDLETFISECNVSLVMRSISILLDGLVFWVKDDELRLSSRQATETAIAAKKLWDRVCGIISSVESPTMINLESLERLFCAAFQSKHRHVVSSMATLWNHLFHNAEEIAYPDELKATLMAIRPMVDIALPGVEDSSEESAAAAQQHAFIGSQDDMDALNISPTKSSRSEGARLMPSGLSFTPSATSLRSDESNAGAPRVPAKNQTKPKLRHEDSQIQFEPVKSTSRDEDESQVLTERQMEVRERQRGQDMLYDMRSSSPVGQDVLPDQDVPSSPPQCPEASDETPKKRTPVVQSTYDDYINTTPTPRRGQMLPLVPDVEMSDPPSSPPEFSKVRRYPLVPEIQTRSRGEDVNWEYTSSPISGSPLPPRMLPPHQDEKQRQELEEGSESKAAEDDAEDAVIADSFAMEVVPSSAPTENEREQAGEVAEAEEAPQSTPPRQQTRTPRRSTRMSVQSTPTTPQQQTSARRFADSPRSENDEFVDALTSPREGAAAKAQNPAPNSSRHSGDTSFALSEEAERSMIRLAEEMEARHNESSKKPPPQEVQRRTRSSKVDTDCITVKTDDGEEEEEEVAVQTPRRRGERVIPSTPNVETPSRPASRKSTSGGRKRKRGTGTRQDEATTKRRRSSQRMDDACSANSSPSLRKRKGAQSQEEEEAQSQLLSEHMAASNRSRLSPELGEDTNHSMSTDIEVADVEAPETRRRSPRKAKASRRASESRAATSDSSSRIKKPANKIVRNLKKALEGMRKATISREDMLTIEDIFVDIKRELYEAERRGRQG
ncbi:related to telomere length regulator protein rif1 [Cephalotrichum gorgonifer]|uniref:Related to telomere length regulator protein rif1 n=1 Tax=Cephalotrichum gorgonifer TaxID=2041049 RepID=A0AAE8MYL6_9PEZI|nr:related to telomere length regulator protein rif1 [Cephalotrichum gorgonifer]